MIGCGYDAAVVDDALAQKAEVAESIDLHVICLDATDRSNARADFFVPIGEQEDNDRPADLLLVESRFGVSIYKILRPRNSLMNDIRARRVFEAFPHNDRLAFLDAARNRALGARNLALDAHFVHFKSRQAIAIHD